LALLGIVRRLSCHFDSADLELSFLAMGNSGTIELDEANFDKEINSDKPVLVDFWAEWCGPCKLIAPLIDEIAREKAGAVKVAKVDLGQDKNQSLGNRFNVKYIPTLLLFKDGLLRDQIHGMTSKKDLLSRIEALA
jgi:thioredoxin 1